MTIINKFNFFNKKEAKHESLVNDDNVILPAEIDDEITDDIIFLAGPIQGADDWQSKAIKYLNKNRDDQDFVIASPRLEYKAKDFDYDKQVEWATNSNKKN